METPPAGPDAGPGARRRRAPVAVGVVAALLVAAALAWWLAARPTTLDLDTLERGGQGPPGSGGSAPPADGGSGVLSTERASQTSALLARIQQALADGDDTQLADLAEGSARSQRILQRWAANVAELGLTGIRMRFVTARMTGPARWSAEVELSYVDAFAGPVPVRTTAAVDLAGLGPARDGRAVVVDAGGDGARTPLWMSADLDVVTDGRVSARVDQGATVGVDRISRLGSVALRQVARTLPDWRGPLVLEVPDDTAEVAHVLGEPEGAYDAVAAVTTTIDGSGSDDASVHVVVNPVVLGTLGNRGEQVVVTHEAVHVATGAATSPGLPLWLMEGFADWAALRVTDLPDDVAAGAILERVRDQGVPGRLPGELEFDPAGDQFGVSYEAAWLAVRLLAERYGAGAAVRFYDQVDGGAPAARAFSRLGTTEADFTLAWQRYLQRLAGVPVDAGATSS